MSLSPRAKDGLVSASIFRQEHLVNALR
jgi:hypothetical protein